MVDALEGLRVLDLTIHLFGPSCTQTLGDFGAEVIKVEPPGGEPGGARSRGWPAINGVSTGHLAHNRNKKSICIDLKNPDSKTIIRRLVETCDIAIQNFRPGVAERLGLGYEECAQINPALIYVVGTGYGATGPYKDRPANDRVGQAMSGLMSATGDPDGSPVSMGPPIIDFLGGMLLTQGVLLALEARHKTGKGQRVNVSLLDSGIAAGIEACTVYLNTGVVRRRQVRPMSGTYKTQDGYVSIVTGFVRGGNPLPLVCKVLEIEDLSQDHRFDSPEKLDENAVELQDIFQRAFLRRSMAEWVQRMTEQDIICVPVYDYGEVFQDPQVQHSNLIMEVDHPQAGRIKLLAPPVKLSDTPGWVHLPPPSPGQHTDEVLMGLGFSEEEVSRFKANGVVM